MKKHSPRDPSRSVRFWLVLLAAGLSGGFASGQGDLPKRTPGETLDVEPQLMLNDLPVGPMPDGIDAPAQSAEFQALEARLAKAKRTAAWSARLFKNGLIAKVQSEMNALTVVRLTMELDRARLQKAAELAAAAQTQLAAGEIAVDQVEGATAELLAATRQAQASMAQWRLAERRDAELNLFRQRQLMASGIGRKTDLRRAEEKLSAIKAAAP